MSLHHARQTLLGALVPSMRLAGGGGTCAVRGGLAAGRYSVSDSFLSGPACAQAVGPAFQIDRGNHDGGHASVRASLARFFFLAASQPDKSRGKPTGFTFLVRRRRRASSSVAIALRHDRDCNPAFPAAMGCGGGLLQKSLKQRYKRQVGIGPGVLRSAERRRGQACRSWGSP